MIIEKISKTKFQLELYKKEMFKCGLASSGLVERKTNKTLVDYFHYIYLLNKDCNLFKNGYICFSNESVILFEVDEKNIELWFVFTEYESRNRGLLSSSLDEISKSFKNKIFKVDTANKFLIKAIEKRDGIILRDY